uniref:Uncharacterized protein n=1 Tax=Siphoviridae sp. ct3o911 TaxID=2827560 RepID=A0A8S5LK16_9CAUD|nr:MAG TPA: hypothetical protein [Siphoviridae sp. ct3o911]
MRGHKQKRQRILVIFIAAFANGTQFWRMYSSNPIYHKTNRIQ